MHTPIWRQQSIKCDLIGLLLRLLMLGYASRLKLSATSKGGCLILLFPLPKTLTKISQSEEDRHVNERLRECAHALKQSCVWGAGEGNRGSLHFRLGKHWGGLRRKQCLNHEWREFTKFVSSRQGWGYESMEVKRGIQALALHMSLSQVVICGITWQLRIHLQNLSTNTGHAPIKQQVLC